MFISGRLQNLNTVIMIMLLIKNFNLETILNYI